MRKKNWLSACAQYLPSRASSLAEAALQVYDGPQVLESVALERWRCREFQFIDVEATQCCVASNYEQIVVSFRGSEATLEDWVADLDWSLVKGPMSGRVHQGFYEALASVWRMLDDRVRQLLAERPRELWITGHSLGGALAMLAAARWHEAGVGVSGMYTYGQPRVGDREFARTYDFALRPCSFRIVNNLDIVTRVPARSMGYAHCGTLVYLTETGEAEHDESWWQQFLNGWCGTIDTIFDWCGDGIEDHRMVNYVALLEDLAPAAAPRLAVYRGEDPPPQRPRRRAA